MSPSTARECANRMERQMNDRAETVRTIDLGYEQMLVIDGGPGSRVRVLYGATWLTEEGETGDAIVGGGDEVALRGGRALIEGLAPTRLQILEARSSAAARAGRWLRRAAHKARQRLDRLQLGAAAAERGA
jgi:hypothetical protein